MLAKKSLLLTAMVVVSTMICGAVEAGGQLPIEGDTPPRTCTTVNNLLTIKGDPYDTGEFPRTAPCTNDDGQQCSHWVYKFESVESGTNLTHTLVSVSADTGIRSIDSCGKGSSFKIIQPGAEEDKFFEVGLNDYGQRWILFNCDADTFVVTIETDLSEPVAGTGAGRAGNKNDFCQIQTPGKTVQIVDPNAAITIQVIEQLDCGNVIRDVNSQGYTTDITPLTGNCTISDDILTNGSEQPTLFIDPNTRVTFEGSSRYCWPNSFGGITCAR